jgi:hypothetical protein
MAGSRSPLPALRATPRGWVRSTEGTILSNSPDGWVSGQGGPAWFLSSDATPAPPEWTRYGYRRYITAGSARLYGNRPVDAEQVGGIGILPAVTRATNLIVGPVVGTSWRYYANAGTDFTDVRQGDEVQARPLWTIDPQLVGRIPGGEANRPTLPQPLRVSGHAFWETVLTHALWWGKGAVLFVEDAFGQPLAGTLRVANPARWGWTDDGRFVLDPDGDDPLESDFDGAFDVGPVQWKMRLVDGWAPVDGDTPSGVLSRSGLVVTAGERMNSYLANVVGTGVPSGVLKVSTPDFDATRADALKSRWMQAHGGTRRSVAVLNAGVDFTPLQLSVVDADLVNAKGAWLVDLAHAFGLSAADLDASNGGTSLTYQNLQDARRARLDDTLAIPGRRVEDFVSSLLPYGTAMRVDWSGYLSTDGRQQLEFVEKGLAGGWLSPAEARDRTGMAPRDDVPDEVEEKAATPPQLQPFTGEEPDDAEEQDA